MASPPSSHTRSSRMSNTQRRAPRHNYQLRPQPPPRVIDLTGWFARARVLDPHFNSRRIYRRRRTNGLGYHPIITLSTTRATTTVTSERISRIQFRQRICKKRNLENQTRVRQLQKGRLRFWKCQIQGQFNHLDGFPDGLKDYLCAACLNLPFNERYCSTCHRFYCANCLESEKLSGGGCNYNPRVQFGNQNRLRLWKTQYCEDGCDCQTYSLCRSGNFVRIQRDGSHSRPPWIWNGWSGTRHNVIIFTVNAIKCAVETAGLFRSQLLKSPREAKRVYGRDWWVYRISWLAKHSYECKVKEEKRVQGWSKQKMKRSTV